MVNFSRLEKVCPDGIPFSKCKEYLEKQKKRTKKRNIKKSSPKDIDTYPQATFKNGYRNVKSDVTFDTFCTIGSNLITFPSWSGTNNLSVENEYKGVCIPSLLSYEVIIIKGFKSRCFPSVSFLKFFDNNIIHPYSHLILILP